MTCSARLPVYAMVAALLFLDEPVKGGLLFAAAYALGIVAALTAAFVLKGTILKGEASPLVIELPRYKLPSLRTAVLHTAERGWMFLKKAGTVILAISIVLWALATFPRMPEPGDGPSMQPTVLVEGDPNYGLQTPFLNALRSVADHEVHDHARKLYHQGPEAAAELESLHAQYATAYSALGRIGRTIQPVFAPLGFDWQTTTGVMASFAAREVIVSTLSITYGIGEDGAEDTGKLRDTLAAQTRADGTPVFNTPTALALLVFFVLAMQCLPTQAVTAKETGSWKWAWLQLGYMTALAWVGAFVTYQVASLVV